MNTKRMLFLIGVAALSFTASLASAAPHPAQMMTRSAVMRPAPRFAPRTMAGTHRWWNDSDNDRDDRFRRFHNRTFIFVDTFGFPFFYPYPYYGYYPYDYYGYNDSGYGHGNTVVEVQRRLARAGYYHGTIDGIMGPQTRRAIRAYERDHNMPAYGVIDRQLLATTGFG
jgi:Putative peptidoglycan binding domain